MTFSESNDFWRGVFTPIQKHHMTGSHAEHIVPFNISEDNEETAECFDSNYDNEYPYDELTELGDGEIPYLFEIALIGPTGVTKYSYIINLDDVTSLKYNDAITRFQLRSAQRPSSGFRPDIDLGILLIVADQQNTTVSNLSAANMREVRLDTTLSNITEIDESDFDLDEAIDHATNC